MNLIKLIEENKEEIIKECLKKLDRMGLDHYQKKDVLDDFYSALKESIKTESSISLVSFTEKLAEERYYDGYKLSEVQTTFNCIEKVIWKKIYDELHGEDFAKAISLISTIMGAAKDILARKYFLLVKKTRIPSLI